MTSTGYRGNPWLRRYEDFSEFHQRAEVVVCGYGGAGASAALEARRSGADVLVLTVEEGAAYAYRYPRYAVIPSATGEGVPASYAVPRGDLEMMQFMNNWIELKRLDGTVDRLYQYWMRGGVTQPRQRRWSVIRDVLGWVE